MKTPFKYLVLRYMHDCFTREFVNVAILLWAPRRGFLRFHPLEESFDRLLKFFPGADRGSLSRTLKFLKGRAISLEKTVGSDLFESQKTLEVIARALLPIDDSSLQWGMEGGGITEDPERILEELYERLVTRHFHRRTSIRREDKDVQHAFDLAFRAKSILQCFSEQTYSAGELVEVFPRSWTAPGRQTRILKSLSFDLEDASGIVAKALSWRGRIDLLRGSRPFVVYYLLGRPEETSKQAAFNQAAEVLKAGPQGTQFLAEVSEADSFAESFAQEIAMPA
ncbi:MAG: DUF3037 domain-containing protein [Verrucomicrobia bacterium]|nr:DUF3037 domain-containing protein [Verrucomicrobiota bacterium]